MAATDFKDYYQILGVSKSAGTDDIKRAFRKLARKYHPDVNPGDQVAEAKFKEAAEAYEVLADDQKRKVYDQYGHAGIQGGMGGATAGHDFSRMNVEDIFSMFSDIFGGGGMGGGKGGGMGDGMDGGMGGGMGGGIGGCIGGGRGGGFGGIGGVIGGVGGGMRGIGVCMGVGRIATTKAAALDVDRMSGDCAACVVVFALSFVKISYIS